jgi:hypothetical protein
MLAPEGIVNWEGASQREYTDGCHIPQHAGLTQWGVSIWRHKLEIIRRAVSEFGAVLWLDFDVRMLRPLPADFWSKLHDGPPIQGAIAVCRRRRCHWRKRDGKRQIIHGGCVYVRGEGVINTALAIARKKPLWWDQTVWAAVMDRRGGGWTSAADYATRGFDLPWYDTNNRMVPVDRRKVIFTTNTRRRVRAS